MVYTADIYDKNGKVVSKVDLSESVFSDDNINPTLIHEFLLLQSSNARKNIACVKGRGEVAVSGKKLFKQKGTGNARAGGKDSPTRKGGGVAFGPRGENNYVKEMPKKAKQKALKGILTLKAQENAIAALKDFVMDAPKTKDASTLLEKIGINGKKVLLVLNEKNSDFEKSFRNITKVKYITLDYLNPYDVMNADKVLFMQSALEKINN